jgi:hypothetical protein
MAAMTGQRPRPASRRRRIGLVAAVGLGVVATFLTAAAAIVTDTRDPGEVFLQGYGSIVYTSVGAVILWRRPGHGIGRIALATGLVFTLSAAVQIVLSVAGFHDPVQPYRPPLVMTAAAIATGLVELLTSSSLILSAILIVAWFPDGRRTSRLGLLVQALLLIAGAAFLVSFGATQAMPAVGWSALLQGLVDIPAAIGAVGVMAAYVSAGLDLGLRYRSAGPIDRLQMRWVVAAVAGGWAGTIAIVAFGSVVGELWQLWILSTMLPVMAIAVAITRYHLYDIDRIVSRTIGYAVITVVLFVVFGLVNLLVQTAIAPFFAEDGRAVGVAISTLTVAAAFAPVRIRVQRAVDRRFHRSRYDAERTVATFAGRLRDQLDLPTITGALRQTADEAVEPSDTAVWLRTG